VVLRRTGRNLLNVAVVCDAPCGPLALAAFTDKAAVGLETLLDRLRAAARNLEDDLRGR
jgi:hypothetical protein